MEAVNTNFKVIGLTRLRMKPESTAPETDALTTRPSDRNFIFSDTELSNLNLRGFQLNILNL